VSTIRRRLKVWRLKKPCAVVAGGSTRAHSVNKGLKAMARRVRWVAVHDAVRPLVSAVTIEKVLVAARRYRAAIAASLSRDTVKLADKSGGTKETFPRERVWLAQTPQCFERGL